MPITATHITPIFDTPQVGATTGSYNTSGYDGLAILVSSYTFTAYTFSDNKNAFSGTGTKFGSGTRATSQAGGGSSAQIYYSWDKTQFGTGHTFTVSGATVFATIFVLGLMGTKTTGDPKSNSTGNDTGAPTSPTSLASGPLTPADNDCLILSLISSGTTLGTTNLVVASGGFTKIAGFDYHNSNGLGSAIASLVQSGSPSAATCTWNINNDPAVGAAASIISFKPPASGGTPSLFKKSNLTGIGAGGPFFADPLGAKSFAKSFAKHNHIYIPKNYVAPERSQRGSQRGSPLA